MITRSSAVLSFFVLLFASVQAMADNSEIFHEPYNDTTKTNSRFVLGGTGYQLDSNIDVRDAIVIVYTHGSRGDDKNDFCLFRDYGQPFDQSFGNTLYPRVFKTLYQQDARIAVYYVCHREVGAKFIEERERRLDPEKLGQARRLERKRETPCHPKKVSGAFDNGRLAKFCKRAKKIDFEISRLIDENPGLRRTRIFLSGGSSGAWASLILATHKKRVAAGVIAFAPATNGKLTRQLRKLFKSRQHREAFVRKNGCKDNRDYLEDVHPKGFKWKSYVQHICQLKYISENLKSTAALVFAYETDPFNSVELLQGLMENDAVSLVKVNQHKLESICGKKLITSTSYPHACHQGAGFVDEYKEKIRMFIANNL